METGQDKGFIKISRKILEWEWYTDSNTKIVFLHCLLKANWKDKNWKGETIKRGQFVTSLEKIAQETNLSVKQVRVALNHLIRTNEVANLSTPQYRIITVKNYDKYQDRANQTANEGQTKGKQRANEGQQLKKEKNNTTYYKEKKEGGTAANSPSGVEGQGQGQEDKPFYGEGMDENGFRTYKLREDYW